MPITDFITAGFYFSSILFFISAILLVALYHFRWKADFLSAGLWLAAYVISGLAAWSITHNAFSVLMVLGVNLFLYLAACPLTPIISTFGVFFLTSMIAPAIFGLIWLFELMSAASAFLKAGWPLYIILLSIEILFSALIILNAIMLSWIVLSRFSTLYFRFPRLKKGWEIAAQSTKNYPLVSIHVPCYNEPPEIVMETLNGLSRLQYSNFEVIVLDNNTKDPAIWQPIESHCQRLGPRFHFHHIEKLSGAKAGALNACLRLTSPQAEFISVMDADYIVQPDFLERLLGFFDDPRVGFVQACQDYRAWENNRYQSACYYEYETHFKLELSGLNEWDVNYTIGTMCIIPRTILDKVGGWAEWCLTEDSEVAVRIHALGYSGYYLKDTFGHGLIPDTFENYKYQRFRWTAGPAQQFQKHWRLYLPWSANGRLTFVQKLGEIFHSLSIFFSEFLNLLITIPVLGICIWFSLIQHKSFVIPNVILLFILVAIVKNIICNCLSIKLLGGSWKDYFLSILASRSLIFTRNTAFCMAWIKRQLLWRRTSKFKSSRNFREALYSSRQEVIAFLIYLAVAFFLFPLLDFWKPDIIFLIWLGIVNQAISFLCAPIMALLSAKSLR